MRRFLAVLVVGALVVLVQPPVANASGPIVVVFESAASTNGSGTTITIPSFTVSNVPNRLLVVGISTPDSASATGVTFDGQNFTKEIDVTQVGGANLGANSEIWFLVAPNVTTADIVVTLNSSALAVIGATLYSGTDQSNPTGVANGNTFPAANFNSTTLNGSEAVGSLVFSSIAVTGISGDSALLGSIVPALGEIERYENGASASTTMFVGGAGSTIAATDPIAVQFDYATLTACCDTAMTAVEIRAATNLSPVVSSFNAQDVAAAGQTVYTFTVEYSDVEGIDVSSIGLADVTVTGPGGALTVTSGTELTGMDGSPKTGTHTVMPPGGSWDAGDVGTYTIGIVGSQVFDIHGKSVAANAALTAFDVTVNTPPTANAGGPYTVGEGGSVVLSGAGSSDPDQSTASLTFKWDLDNDTMFDDATGITTAFSASGVDGIGQVVTVGLEVSDSDGASDTTTTTVTINNVAPSVTAALDLPEVLLGLTVSTNMTFSDPGLTDSPWTYVITWGDTSMDIGSTSNQSAAIVESHVYSAPGMFTVGVCVTDKDSGVGCDSTMITVLTPEEALENLGDDIDDLETMAVLTTGQANALTQKTAAATNKLDMGNKVAALNQLMAFINHVNALVTGSVLTPTEGQTLIDQVNLIIDSINATC